MEAIAGSQAVSKVRPKAIKTARSRATASRGINTANDFTQLMSELMSDLIEGKVTPAVGNACVNAGSKLLKCVELKFKYGAPTENGDKNLTLAGQ